MKRLNQLIKYAMALGLHYSGYNRWQLQRGGHYALMFHRLCDEPDHLSMALPPHFVRAIVQWTKDYGEPVAVQTPASKSTHFSFSFDDGYADNERIPEVFGQCPVTVYLATAFIGSDNEFWAIELQDRILTSPAEQLDLHTFDLGFYELKCPQQRKQALYQLNISVKNLRPEDIATVMAQVSRQLPLLQGQKRNKFLSWDSVKQLHQQGVQLGSHTHNHVISARISDQEFLAELETCHQLFEHHLGFIPRHFAYPNGRAQDISAGSSQVLQQLAYLSAATTIEGANVCGDSPFRIKRFNMAKNRLTTPWGRPSRAMFTTMLVNPFKLH